MPTAYRITQTGSYDPLQKKFSRTPMGILKADQMYLSLMAL